MPAAPQPPNEESRIAALRSYDVLDTACEASFDNIAHLAATMMDTPMALISFIDTERQWFKSRVGIALTETPRAWAFCAHAILDPHALLVVPDARRDPRFRDNPLVVDAPDIRFYAGAPLVNSAGAALGALCVIDQVPRRIRADQRLTLSRLAQTAVATLEMRRAMLRAHDQALADDLTGLPNRPAIIGAVERAIARQERSGGALGLLYLDLDGFKSVNDIGGHAAGDEVLKAVARVLETGRRRDDCAGRLGGDEFAIVLGGEASDAFAAAERVRGEIERRMPALGWPVTASIGAATFLTPPGGADLALAAADGLMYAAKKAGGNRVRRRVFP